MTSIDNDIKFNASLLSRELKKPECRDYFMAKYEGVMKYYWKFLKDAGPNCSIVLAALNSIWREEMQSEPKSFQTSLRTGVWGSQT